MVLIPIESIARESCRVARIAMAYRQIQRHHTVTPGSVGKRVLQTVRAGGDVMVLIPIESVARESCRVARIAMAYRQMQRHHTVTPGSVGKRVRQTVRTGGNIVVLVPVEAVASKRRGIARVAVAQRQVQGYHAVAATGIGERVRQAVRAGGNIVVLVPVEAVAGKCRRVARVAMAQRQVQRHH